MKATQSLCGGGEKYNRRQGRELLLEVRKPVLPSTWRRDRASSFYLHHLSSVLLPTLFPHLRLLWEQPGPAARPILCRGSSRPGGCPEPREGATRAPRRRAGRTRPRSGATPEGSGPPATRAPPHPSRPGPCEQPRRRPLRLRSRLSAGAAAASCPEPPARPGRRWGRGEPRGGGGGAWGGAGPRAAAGPGGVGPVGGEEGAFGGGAELAQLGRGSP